MARTVPALLLLLTLSCLATAQSGLPEGAGRDLVLAHCTSCHGTAQIERSAGFGSAAEWQGLFSTMIKLPRAQSETIAAYLAEHFPEDASRRPTLVAGDTQIDIIEWMVPTLGQRSRDPVEAKDGSIWWTGMWASLAGRLDPKTGEMEEFLLPPAARPHTVVPADDGSIWYTGNSNATIGRRDPETGLVTELRPKHAIRILRPFIPTVISISPRRALACSGG